MCVPCHLSVVVGFNWKNKRIVELVTKFLKKQETSMGGR